MENLYREYLSGASLDKLTQQQLETAIFRLDEQLEKEADGNKVVQYCLLKVDLINSLMLLNKSNTSPFIR